MLNAKELRLGNCVMAEGRFSYISQLMWNRLEIFFNNGSEKIYKEIPYDLPMPVLLSTEILEKCGFIKQQRFHFSNVFYSENGNFIINQLKNSCEISFGLDRNFSINCKRDLFLHQLQNLYFALQGEDLAVTL